MSFRDSDERAYTAPAEPPEFHPVRDLINNIFDQRHSRQLRPDRDRSYDNRYQPDYRVPERYQPYPVPDRRQPAYPTDRNYNRNYSQPDRAEVPDAPPTVPVQFTDYRSAQPPSRQPEPYRGPDTRPYFPVPSTQYERTPRAATVEPEQWWQRAPEAAFQPGGAPEQLQTPGEIPDSPGRLLPDTIAIKERNGNTIEVPDERGVSADARLARYLSLRGPELAELDLSGSTISDSGLSLLNKAPHLAKLLLNDTDITNDSMKVLGEQRLANLQELNLNSTRVGDEGIAQLRNLPLRVLNIGDTATSDDCMQQIKRMRNLETLNADYSGVGNEGVRAMQEMPNLRSVSLKGCPITDDCVKDLARCQNLMVLNLEDTRLSPAKVRWLQRQMPRCLIVPPEGQGEGTQGQTQHKPFRLLQKLFEGPSPRR